LHLIGLTQKLSSSLQMNVFLGTEIERQKAHKRLKKQVPHLSAVEKMSKQKAKQNRNHMSF
jgi:hypothetical protein